MARTNKKATSNASPESSRRSGQLKRPEPTPRPRAAAARAQSAETPPQPARPKTPEEAWEEAHRHRDPRQRAAAALYPTICANARALAARRGFDRDEAQGIAALGLVRAMVRAEISENEPNLPQLAAFGWVRGRGEVERSAARSRQWQILQDSADVLEVREVGVLGGGTACSLSVEEELVCAERSAFVARLLDRATPKQREVVELHFMEGLTMEAVARRLGIPRDTAKSRLHSAVVRMRARAREEERAEFASAREEEGTAGP